jgi:hypothetical protein
MIAARHLPEQQSGLQDSWLVHGQRRQKHDDEPNSDGCWMHVPTASPGIWHNSYIGITRANPIWGYVHVLETL